MTDKVTKWVEIPQEVYADMKRISIYLIDHQPSDWSAITTGLDMDLSRSRECLDTLIKCGYVSKEDNVYYGEHFRLCSHWAGGVRISGFIRYLIDNGKRLTIPENAKKLDPSDEYIRVGYIRNGSMDALKGSLQRYWKAYLETVPEHPSTLEHFNGFLVGMIEASHLIQFYEDKMIISVADLRMFLRVAITMELGFGLRFFSEQRSSDDTSVPTDDRPILKELMKQVFYTMDDLMDYVCSSIRKEYGKDSLAYCIYSEITDRVHSCRYEELIPPSCGFEPLFNFSEEDRKALAALDKRVVISRNHGIDPDVLQ